MKKIIFLFYFLTSALLVQAQTVTLKDLDSNQNSRNVKVAAVKNAGVTVGYVAYYHSQISGNLVYKARYYDLNHNQVGPEQEPFGLENGSSTLFGQLDGITDWSLTTNDNLGLAIATEKANNVDKDIIGYHTVNPATGIITEVLDERVVDGFSGANGSAQAVILNNGNIAVAYRQGDPPAGANENTISFDIVNPTTGATIVSASIITTEGFSPQTTLLADGSFIVTYAKIIGSGSPTQFEFYARRYGQDGTAIGTEFLIFSSSSNSFNVQALLSDGRLIFFQDNRAKFLSFTPTATTLSAEISVPVTFEATSSTFRPAYTISAFDNGGFVLGFLNTDDASYLNFQYRIFDNNGVATFTGNKDITPRDLTLLANNPYVQTLPNGSFVAGVANNRSGLNTNATIQLAVVQPASVLFPGDIALTSYNSDGDDEFSFVLLENIASGQTIYFTENGWDDDANGGGANPTWGNTTEGTLTWTATSNLTAGTEIQISDPASSSISASSGTVTRSGSWSVSGTGDVVIAYEGTGIPNNGSEVAAFLWAFNSGSAG